MIEFLTAAFLFLCLCVAFSFVPLIVGRLIIGLLEHKPSGWGTKKYCSICWTKNHDILDPCPELDKGSQTPGMLILKTQIDKMDNS